MRIGNLEVPAEGYQWQPVKTWQLSGWLLAYALLMWSYRAGGMRILDGAYLVVHEAGHPLFSYSGSEWLTIAGGTFLQLFVPAALAASFAWRGHTLGTAFCSWALFNSLTNVAIYMMDARSKGLPLVAPGVASDEVEGHDWDYLFSSVGLLQHDITIGRATMFLAWVGMFVCAGWLIWMWRRYPAE